MAFDLHLTLPEDSPVAQAVRRVAASEHISHEAAAEQLISQGAELRVKRTPAQEMLGAFGSPEEVALLDEVMEIVHARRAADLPRDLDL